MSQCSKQMRERAAAYALGVLSLDERAAFERHLAAGCPSCVTDLEAYDEVSSMLAHSATPAAPGAPARAAVLERIGAEAALEREPAIQRGGLRFVRADGLGWTPSPLAGVHVKPLSRDPGGDRTTRLVRMEGGATYPTHRHGGVEEIYLLEGDLLVSGVLMRAGDYCRAEPDTVHDGVRTPNGCTFVVTFSERNELLA